MKNRIRFLAFFIILANVFLFKSDVGAANVITQVKRIPFNKSVSESISISNELYYMFDSSQAGIVTLLMQLEPNTKLSVELWSVDDEQNVECFNIMSEISTFDLYIHPTKYYIKITTQYSNVDFNMQLNFQKFNTVDNNKQNLTLSDALPLSAKSRYDDFLAFNEKDKYYSISVGKNKKLNLKIKGFDERTTNVFVFDSKQNLVLNDWFFGTSKVFEINESVDSGIYYIKISMSGTMNTSGRLYSIETEDYIGIEKISLDNSKKTIYIGEKYKLKTVTNPKVVTEKFTYSSSNTKIATVSSNGTVNGVGSGVVTITVQSKDSKRKATCTITVKKIEVVSVKLTENQKTLIIGDSFKLKATINPTNATDKDITWKSSNTKVAKVDRNGNITATGNGECTVSAISGKITEKCSITVNPAPTPQPIKKPKTTPAPTPTITPPKPTEVAVDKITMSSSAKRTVGETIKLNVIISPTNATNKTLTWSSTNTDVAAVSDGVVTCKSEGNATIIVTTENEKKAYCSIVVSK
ncbi:Ig-like domain-containing protein [Lachnoclostridium sp.]|uniref:Ig-like domain-containing protein n=1 Tax=Lachnoclostridium sp. TaxID=2028282 RepID=UPI00289E1B42|nr:Ig-like domain-containing protein [Lachnoclostridium sp.]